MRTEFISDGPDAPFPGMAQAFEAYYSQKWNDMAWRRETSVWAAAWKAARSLEHTDRARLGTEAA